MATQLDPPPPSCFIQDAACPRIGVDVYQLILVPNLVSSRFANVTPDARFLCVLICIAESQCFQCDLDDCPSLIWLFFTLLLGDGTGYIGADCVQVP